MFEVLVVIQLVGGVLSFFGAYCRAALPLTDYRWYNRVAVIVLLGPMVSWIAILRGMVWLIAKHDVEPISFAIFTLTFGTGMLWVLYSSINAMALRVMLGEGQGMSHGVWFMPIGMAVQIIPSMLTVIFALAGVRI